ncbi:MAG: hypothetical protein AB1374_02335 [Bacillota bacterium]
MEIKLPEGGSPVKLSFPEDAVKDAYVETWQKLVYGLLDSYDEETRCLLNIALEFECGECCKKVLNGANIFFIPVINVAVLLPPYGQQLLLKVISCGHVVDKERLKIAIIPISRICNLEIGAEQIDP